MGQKKDELDVVSVRLVREASILSGHKITTPTDAVMVLGEQLRDFDREVMCVINLRNDGTPINCHFASTGTLMGTLASPRELFKTSILSNAASMILMHNHPGGTLAPSADDVAITDKMIQLCALMEIPLMDHIIVGSNGGYFSFREKRMLKEPDIPVCKDYQELSFTRMQHVS